jgi:serine/threonine-protein kinase
MVGTQERLAAALAERYLVERELGQGGMATVYLAEDLRHHRPIALKVLLPDLAASVGIERFLREIEIAAALTHPHILPLHDSGQADGLVYYVMPYVEGESLRDRLERERRIPVADAVGIAREVVSALDYAHRHGVVHRDIKPENIMLYEGLALVTDFGIALGLSSGGSGRLTTAGIAIGTPAYMSPEQAMGDPVDARSDLYSLGCVLYEMLAGAPPFTGESAMAITAQKLVDPVPPLRASHADVPAWLEGVALKTLTRDPAGRYQSAAELGEALELANAGTGAAGSAAAAPAAKAQPSIAVLPFANMSAEPDNEFFSDGIAEELMNALSKLEGLHVVARASAFTFKGKNEDVREIGRRLGVSTVLEGSVRKAGNRVRVNAELINVQDGYRLWSERFDRQLDDVFAIQDEIAGAIARVLEAKLLGAPAAVTGEGRVPGDAKAYECYLRGRHQWNKRTESGLTRGIEDFEKAIALDARYAPAYAGLADSHVMLGIYGLLPPDVAMPKAKLAAQHALDVDASLAEAHASLGCVLAVYDWDWPAADAAFRRAIALNPQYATAHQWYAMNCLVPQGRFPEARAQFQQAQLLDPLSLTLNCSIGLAEFFARNYDAAVEKLREAVEIDENFGTAQFFLGQVYAQLGRHEEAAAVLERAIGLSERSPETVAALARAHAVAGRREEATRLLASLVRRSEDAYVSPALIADVHLGLGEREEGLAWLEKAAVGRSADLVWIKVRPVYDEIREDPRFRALLARTKLA